MNIKQKAIQQAIKMLDASGARYHILTEEGDILGEPFIQSAGPERRRRAAKGTGPIEHHKAALAALNPGESIFLECSSEMRNTVQTYVCSFMHKVFGSGNYMSTRCAEGIEVLVLAKKETAEPVQAELPVTYATPKFLAEK